MHFSIETLRSAMTKEPAATSLAEELKLVTGTRVRVAEPLARYTSIKVGGPADYFLEVADHAALGQVLRVLHRYGMPFFPLGKGSNVLISDRGVRSAVIRLGSEFNKLDWVEEGEKVWVNVGAACLMAQLVREAARRGYSGLEFAEGIPGTVGGALVMNAGAYGTEIEKVVDQVEGVSREGQPIRFSRKEMLFSYRDSHLPPATIVTRVKMRLGKGDPEAISSRIRELVARRKQSQPSGYPNSGSMFRNPPGDFAGRLIEAAGLKGKRVGGAQISERHANFIVNLGGASAEQVMELMESARAEVRKRFGVELVREIHLLGEWSLPSAT